MRPSNFSVLSALLGGDVVDDLRVEAGKLTFDKRPDSVDGAPAHELYVIKDGTVHHTALAAKIRPALEQARSHINSYWPICQRAGGCTACTSLIRRYRPDERRMHYEHVDGHAAATAVLSLSPATDYRGGLYLSNLTSRTLLPLEAGDAVVHASDLFHGVDVTDGERWSLVIWFRTCQRCTMHGSADWYRERAESGEPFAAFLHASRASQALSDPRERHAIAARFYNISANGGFAPAMHSLGNAFITGEGVAVDLRRGATWLERAVASGSDDGGGFTLGGPSVGSRAAFDLARLLLRGEEFGWPSPLSDGDADPSSVGRDLLTAAAASGHVRAGEALRRL